MRKTDTVHIAPPRASAHLDATMTPTTRRLSRAFDADANDDDAHARVGGRERAAVLVALIEREGDDDDETTNRWAFDVILCVRAEGMRAHAQDDLSLIHI